MMSRFEISKGVVQYWSGVGGVTLEANSSLRRRTEGFHLFLVILARLWCICPCASVCCTTPCCYSSVRCAASEVNADGRLTGRCCNQATRVFVTEVVFRSIHLDDTKRSFLPVQCYLVTFPITLLYFLKSLFKTGDVRVWSHRMHHAWPEVTCWLDSSHQQLGV